MNVPLLDLRAQYLSIRSEVEAAVTEVLDSQVFILGPRVQECEREIARYSNCAHGVGMSSGTDALVACLMAENIGPGDEVITTPYTFFATVGSIARLGAKPVFVDIDPVTYNLDVSQVESRVTAKTRAIMPVHLYGQMAAMDEIMDVAKRHKLVVIEDAAQAIGAEYKGKRAGSIGDYGCFSFFPSKNLGAAGDAGMVVTNNAEKLEKLKLVRAHGSKPKYYHKIVGGNFRLDAIQAAIISVKLRYLDQWTVGRQRNAERYTRLFRQSGISVSDTSVLANSPAASGAEKITAQKLLLPAPTSDRHIFNQYIIRTRERDALKKMLEGRGVGTEIYYPVPMHVQECFSYLGYKKGDFPQAEAAANETLAVPIYPELSDEQAKYVAGAVAEFFRGKQ
jgi:dTDP-4-amino-4,6-dideoxygalactose transaminase